MPHDCITSIQQTSEGFLWVGTPQGLVRFDGWKFAPVKMPAGKDFSDDPANITAQCVDSKNQLWFGTERNGLFRLNTNDVSRLTAESAGFAGEKIFCLDSDESGAVWAGTELGLAKWENGQMTRFAAESGSEDPAVIGLQVTRSNGVWITTRNGLRKFHNGVIERGEFDPKIPQRSAPFWGVFEDRRGSLWGLATPTC